MRDFVKDWIASLLSGQFQQSTGGLKNQSGHCCLGVLCEIQGLREFRYSEESKFVIFVTEDDESSTLLPRELAEKLGSNPAGSFNTLMLSEASQEIVRRGSFGANSLHINSLSQLNDNGITFKEIAAVIADVEENNAWLTTRQIVEMSR